MPPPSFSSLSHLPLISRQSSESSTSSSVIQSSGSGDQLRVFPVAAVAATCDSASAADTMNPVGASAAASAGAAGAASCTTPSPVQGTRVEKEEFMEFTKILMKYLQLMNPSLCKKAQILLVQCSDNHRRQVNGYENLSVTSLRQRLRNLVGDAYWARVEAHHKRYMQVQRAKRRKVESVRIANMVMKK